MSTKQEQAQEVIYQNRIDFLKTEHDRLFKAKEALSSEIGRKTTDYELYMGQKDAESKRLRQDALDSQEQLAKDKAEFQGILKQFQSDKSALEKEQHDLNTDRVKVCSRLEQIGHFIQAVQRDITVLGL